MMSSILAPPSRFSKMADTGIRVPFKTHAPLTLPGTLSTAGHSDQLRLAICSNSLFQAPGPGAQSARMLNWSHPMLWSKLFIPTLRENPAEAEVASHQLLLRADRKSTRLNSSHLG